MVGPMQNISRRQSDMPFHAIMRQVAWPPLLAQEARAGAEATAQCPQQQVPWPVPARSWGWDWGYLGR